MVQKNTKTKGADKCKQISQNTKSANQINEQMPILRKSVTIWTGLVSAAPRRPYHHADQPGQSTQESDVPTQCENS